MKTLKHALFTALLTSGALVICLAITATINTRTLSDSFFLAGLFFLIVGVALWIMASGFFDQFQKIMKHFLQLKKSHESKTFILFSEIGRAHYAYWLETSGFLLLPAILFYWF